MTEHGNSAESPESESIDLGPDHLTLFGHAAQAMAEYRQQHLRQPRAALEAFASDPSLERAWTEVEDAHDDRESIRLMLILTARTLANMDHDDLPPELTALDDSDTPEQQVAMLYAAELIKSAHAAPEKHDRTRGPLFALASSIAFDREDSPEVRRRILGALLLSARHK